LILTCVTRDPAEVSPLALAKFARPVIVVPPKPDIGIFTPFFPVIVLIVADPAEAGAVITICGCILSPVPFIAIVIVSPDPPDGSHVAFIPPAPSFCSFNPVGAPGGSPVGGDDGGVAKGFIRNSVPTNFW